MIDQIQDFSIIPDPALRERVIRTHVNNRLEKLLAVCRRDPDTFINYAMSYGAQNIGPNPWFAPTETYYDKGESFGITCIMHRKWQEAISQHDWVYIEAPREHAKTTRIAGRVIWELGKAPDLRVKYVGQNDEKPTEVVTMVALNIQLNPRVHEVFPDLLPDEYGTWAKHKIYVKRKLISKDASLEGTGVMATGVGGRADWLIFDDPVDFKNAIQFPALRDFVKKAYKDVWINLLPSRGGRVTYICTPWHKEDLSHEIKRKYNKRYFMLSTPIDKELTPLWPAKWDMESLAGRREEIGGRAFDRGFHLKALSDEDQLFRMNNFIECADFTFALGKLPGDLIPGEAKGWKFYTGVDLGSSRKQGTPRTSIFTFGVNKTWMVPVEIKAAQFGETEKLKQIEATYLRYKPEIVAVENNSYQITTINLMKELGIKIPLQGIYTGSQKVDINQGLPSLSLEIENHMWTFAAKAHENILTEAPTAVCRCPVCVLIDEAVSWPIGLSDILMSWWIAREGHRSLTSKSANLIHVIRNKPKAQQSGSRIDGWRRDVLIGDEEDD